MKKRIALLLSLAMVLGLAACGGQDESTPAPTDPETTKAAESTAAETVGTTEEESTTEAADIFAKGEGVMTYDEFMKAELMQPVVIEAFVQGKQAYYDAKGTANVYLADKDGAYYCYELTMTKEQYDGLTDGAKVKISGEKAEYAGEIEVGNGVLDEIEEGTYVAEAVEAASLVAQDSLADHMNARVTFSDMVIVAQDDGAAVNKKESDSDPDLYFRAANEFGTVDFCVESFLTGADTDAYKAVEALKLGDIVKVDAFLYWYNGANPHVLGAEVSGNVNDKSEGVMDHAAYIAAAKAEPVTIEAYVQDKQAYYAANATASLYLADADGAYFCYNCAMTQEEYDKLETGTKVRISGEMGEYAGEIEVAEGKVEEIMDGRYIAPAVDVTALIGDEALAGKMNQKVVFKGLTVVPQEDGQAISKKESDSDPDIYFAASAGAATDSEEAHPVIDFCIESYLTGADTEVYQAAEALNIGDTVDIEAFLYWYNGANPHVTAITKAE